MAGRILCTAEGSLPVVVNPKDRLIIENPKIRRPHPRTGEFYISPDSAAEFYTEGQTSFVRISTAKEGHFSIHLAQSKPNGFDKHTDIEVQFNTRISNFDQRDKNPGNPFTAYIRGSGDGFSYPAEKVNYGHIKFPTATWMENKCQFRVPKNTKYVSFSLEVPMKCTVDISNIKLLPGLFPEPPKK